MVMTQLLMLMQGITFALRSWHGKTTNRLIDRETSQQYRAFTTMTTANDADHYVAPAAVSCAAVYCYNKKMKMGDILFVFLLLLL